jgi:hypothetical protein
MCITNYALRHEDEWRSVCIDPPTYSSLIRGEWSASLPGRFTPGERASCTHWIGGWMGPRTGLDVVERRKILPLPVLELRPLGRADRSTLTFTVI